MTAFDIGIPTQIAFGPGSLSRFASVCEEHAWHKALVIASDRMSQRGFAASFLDRLPLETQIWTDVESNPRVGTVDECVAEFRDREIDVVIGIGGGSAMDQAKATAVGLRAGSSVAALVRGEAPMPTTKAPLALVPTTSGTGSEASWGAILTDAERAKKGGLRGRVVSADYAFVDPSCTLGLSESITMTTGFDVLTHALETFLSKKRSRYTTMLSRQSMQSVFRYLPVLKSSPRDLGARTEMAFASTLAGVNLALSSTCLPHRLQYPLGALTDTPHAEGLAALYPSWLASTLPHATADLAECARWLGGTASSDRDLADWFVQQVDAFMGSIGMLRRLSDFGVDESTAEKLVSQVSGALENDPGDVSSEALRRIYLQSV